MKSQVVLDRNGMHVEAGDLIYNEGEQKIYLSPWSKLQRQSMTIQAQKYAVFSHREHVSKLRGTLDAISHEWRPEWGQALSNRGVETPAFFERYTEEFDPRTGMGGMEVWVPIRP